MHYEYSPSNISLSFTLDILSLYSILQYLRCIDVSTLSNKFSLVNSNLHLGEKERNLLNTLSLPSQFYIPYERLIKWCLNIGTLSPK
jgi:hypothetical protein